MSSEPSSYFPRTSEHAVLAAVYLRVVVKDIQESAISGTPPDAVILHNLNSLDGMSDDIGQALLADHLYRGMNGRLLDPLRETRRPQTSNAPQAGDPRKSSGSQQISRSTRGGGGETAAYISEHAALASVYLREVVKDIQELAVRASPPDAVTDENLSSLDDLAHDMGQALLARLLYRARNARLLDPSRETRRPQE